MVRTVGPSSPLRGPSPPTGWRRIRSRPARAQRTLPSRAHPSGHSRACPLSRESTQYWTPSGSGILNSTAPGRTAFDRRVAALKGLKKVAGGSATAVPPDSRPPHGPNPGRGSRGHGTTPGSSSRAPHQAAPGRPYNRFSTCWFKGQRPAESTVDRHRTPQGAHTTGTRTPNPLTDRQPAEREQNQRRGSADLCVRPLLIHPQSPAPMGRERFGTATAPSRHGLGGCSMTEADEPRNMARHRNDEGLSRSQVVLGPSARSSPEEGPAERTQRSALPPCWLYWAPTPLGSHGWSAHRNPTSGPTGQPFPQPGPAGRERSPRPRRSSAQRANNSSSSPTRFIERSARRAGRNVGGKTPCLGNMYLSPFMSQQPPEAPPCRAGTRSHPPAPPRKAWEDGGRHRTPSSAAQPHRQANGPASAGWWKRPIPARLFSSRTTPIAHVPCRGTLP